MAKVRVHVGIHKGRLTQGAEPAEALFARLRLEDIDVDRLNRFGVLTGSIDEADLERLRDEDCVDWVETDGVQRAL